MTPPVFIVDTTVLASAAAGSVLDVTGEEGRHGARARRLRAGEPVDLVDGLGLRAHGSVRDVGAAAFSVAVVGAADQEPPPTPHLTVVQALAAKGRGEAAVEMLTECGVDRIVPWAAERSVAEWHADRADRGVARWRAVATAASKQSRRSRIPQLDAVARTGDVAELLAGAALGLVLHEEAAARLARVTPPGTGDIVLVVGPEGGIRAAELATFEAAGALAVRMGESILRTSTAGVAAAAVVLAATRRWG